jgi:hypothetical protein
MSSAPAQVSNSRPARSCSAQSRMTRAHAGSSGPLEASSAPAQMSEQSSKANRPEGPLEFRILGSAGQLWQSQASFGFAILSEDLSLSLRITHTQSRRHTHRHTDTHRQARARAHTHTHTDSLFLNAPRRSMAPLGAVRMHAQGVRDCFRLPCVRMCAPMLSFSIYIYIYIYTYIYSFTVMCVRMCAPMSCAPKQSDTRGFCLGVTQGKCFAHACKG